MRMALKVGCLLVLGLTAAVACGSPKASVSDWGPVSTDVERAVKCGKLPEGVASVKWSARTIGANSRIPGPTGHQMHGIAWLTKPGTAADTMKFGNWDPVKAPAAGFEKLGVTVSLDGWFRARPSEDGSVVSRDLLYFNASENAVYFSVTDPTC